MLNGFGQPIGPGYLDAVPGFIPFFLGSGLYPQQTILLCADVGGHPVLDAEVGGLPVLDADVGGRNC